MLSRLVLLCRSPRLVLFFQGLHCNRQLFTLVALLPPVVVAVFVQDVGKLVVLTVSSSGQIEQLTMAVVIAL